MKVIGVRTEEGDFEGRHYKNYKLFCLSDSVRQGVTNLAGICPDFQIKVKPAVLEDVVDPEKVTALLNHDIDCYYDQYRNVCKIIVK